MSSTPQKIIIDCDAGVDDCQALMLALSHHVHSKIQIIAITCVSGNVHISKVIQNVKRCLVIKAIEQSKLHSTSLLHSSILQIPIYYGASEPLVIDVDEDVKDAKFWHGNDGIGGSASAVDLGIAIACGSTETATKLLNSTPTETTPASVKIGQLILTHPNEITIVALGPLTNIALACKLYSSFPILTKQLIFMGGTRYARGNANLTSEFNAFGDPEALQICLRSFTNPQNHQNIVMVGWDLTCKTGVPFDYVQQQWFHVNDNGSDGIEGDNPVSAFLALISAEIVHKSQQGPWSKCGLLIPDPLAMCAALCFNTVVKNTQQYFATCELNGKRTRGQVVIDYDGLFSVGDVNEDENRSDDNGKGGVEGSSVETMTGKIRNLTVVTEMDVNVVMKMLSESTRSNSKMSKMNVEYNPQFNAALKAVSVENSRLTDVELDLKWGTMRA